MRAFTYSRMDSIEAAAQSAIDDSQFIAGGTNLIDLMKADIARPQLLIDITRLPLKTITDLPNGGLRLGALATNAATAPDPWIETRYPLLARAILAGASAQLRNVATDGGNLLQRTRCYYFYQTGTECNKREPGSGCAAVAGFNRIHAILGVSEHCIATHPSDMCVALAALAAIVRLTGRGGDREIPFADFHHLPGDTPHVENCLQPGEVVTAIDLPADAVRFASRSAYHKVRDRASYAFALVSVAAALTLDGSNVQAARLALGGVAHKPWRDEEAERKFVGGVASAEAFGAVAEFVLRDAKSYQHNAFKIELTKRTVVQALLEAAARG